MGSNPTPERSSSGRLLFVYGTLMQGFGNHRLIADADFVGKARIDGLTLVGDDIPRAVKREDAHVDGEVYRVSREQLARVDELEGHPHVYRRKRVTCTFEDGDQAEVMYYHFQLSHPESPSYADFREWR